MKTFLFATDFSKSSNKVAYFAAQLASNQHARLVLFHSYRFLAPYETDFGYTDPPLDLLERVSQRKLKDLKIRLHRKVDKNLEIITHTPQGLVVDTVQETIRDFHANLLIMCVAGNSPSGASYFGSIATNLITKVKIPLLLLPPKTKIGEIQNVVLAVDLQKPIDSIALEKGILLLKELKVILDVVFVAESEKEANSIAIKDGSMMVREMLRNIPHTFQTVVGENPVKEIIKFLKLHKAQMLLSMPKHHNFFEKLFLESYTQRLAFGAKMPVLAVS
jgi:nucleotide-binding universal stress UspA family protein